MKTNEYDYELPRELIANTPLKNRDQSRLLVLDKKTGAIEHKHFHDLINYLKKDDVLVLNNTKVLPARLYATKKATGAKIEILLIENIKKDVWKCLINNSKKVSVSTHLVFEKDVLEADCLVKEEEGIAFLEFKYVGDFIEIINKLGEMPLPPYIKTKLVEQNRYQTIYAKHIGSVAAPTAGLHFTEELLTELIEKGLKIVYITLHVGLGTFRPIKTADIKNHKMHSEFYHMNQETADILNIAKKKNQKIVAIGTTSVRTLETIYNKYNSFKECTGHTDIFIYPGYEFKAIDKLITNFHLPKSTLLLLVSAFASKEYIFKAYNNAISQEYRFFSFGDAMFIK